MGRVWEHATGRIFVMSGSFERAGGVPVLLPVFAGREAAVTAVSRLDGVLIAGGADLNPELYGERPDPHVTTWYDDRDASELWVLQAAEDADLPVLGVCRGMQLMAVAAGGTLVQHLPDAVGHTDHAGGPSDYGQIQVTLRPGHRISTLLESSFIAPCHHHQAVSTHPGFIGTAEDGDGVLQAMEGTGERFELAVQWHPETGRDLGLFEGLVAAAGARSRS